MWSNHRSLLFAAAVLVAVLSACAPSEAVATPKPPAAAAALEDVAPLFTDDFSTRMNAWYTDTANSAVIDYAGGGLRIKAWAPNYFAASHLRGGNYADFHIEVTAKDNDPDHNHMLGLICGRQPSGDSFYYFALDPENQAFEIARRSSGGDVVLTGNSGWTIDHSIPLDAASYKLGADCGRGTLALYVNGHLLQSIKDSTFGSGGVGVFVWSEAASAGPVIFDDVMITGMK